MRVNVYAEELTERPAEHITKDMRGEGLDTVFHAVRLYLGFPWIHRDGDDDSSAITFWVPWTKRGGHDFDRLINILYDVAAVLEEARDEEG